MAIAITLREYLDETHLPYDSMQHTHTRSSLETASAAHQPNDKVAKSVLVKDGDRYMPVVLPASRRLHLGELHRMLNRPVGLATESEVAEVFYDCDLGAVPPTGLLYDIDTIVDDSLLQQDDVYFEAGDHEQLIHMRQADFRRLLGDAMRGHVSHT